MPYRDALPWWLDGRLEKIAEGSDAEAARPCRAAFLGQRGAGGR